MLLRDSLKLNILDLIGFFNVQITEGVSKWVDVFGKSTLTNESRICEID